MIMRLWVGVLLVCAVVAASDSTWNIRDHLSTHSMYTPHDNFTAPPAGCEPVQINLVARHGARFPGKSDIQRFSDLQTKMNQYQNLYAAPYQWMGQWKNPYVPLENDLLTLSGQVEHYNLAQRMMDTYPKPMSQPYEPFVYQYQSSAISRSGRSGNAFAYSMLQDRGRIPYPTGHYAPFFLYTNSPDQDTQLRFFDVCPEYVHSVDDNNTAIEQANIYQADQVAAAGRALSQIIGVSSVWNISASEISLMYKGCGYDIATRNVTSHFCTLFTDPQIGQVLEYWNDLETYYQKGYGYPINYKIATLLLQDVFNIHSQYVNGQNTILRGKFRFGHAETIMPLISILGFYKDPQPLMANWTQQQQDQRQWKTSDISPFAANVQFVLYQCGSDFKIKILVNEVEQVVDGCSDVYCDYGTVLQAYEEMLHLSYKELCYENESICSYYCS